MFDTIITKCVKPKQVVWSGPNKMALDLGDEQGLQNYTLLKGAETYLHKQIEVKPSTSKELFKKQEEIWKQFKNAQLDKLLDNPNETQRFSLEKDTVLYLVNDSHEIVDIIDLETEKRLEEFKDVHKKFILEITTMERTRKFFTDGKGGIIKLPCYRKDIDVTTEDYVPVVMLELNNEKSVYKVYSGIFIYSTFTFVPSISPNYDDDKLSHFISMFDMENSLVYAEQKAEELYDSYINFKENPVEISARELTNLLKRVGYKLELDTTDKIYPIKNMTNEENNEKIQNFYNTFTFTTGESALDIIKLSELKKTFRYNKITLVDILSILSREYLEYDGSKITADILGDIMFKLYDSKNADKIQTESIKQEVN